MAVAIFSSTVTVSTLIITSLPVCIISKNNHHFPKLYSPSISASATSTVRDINVVPCNGTATSRRSGNYEPTSWGFDYIQSLNNGYEGERYVTRANELKTQVKKMLIDDDESLMLLEQLELIDNLQRFGISYHFEDEITKILTKINDDKIIRIHDDLYATALEFRLLRQHRFNVSQDIFDCFKNEEGELRASLCDDTKGLLQLYEASFLAIEGEDFLDMAREIAIKHLQDKRVVDDQVNRALELPFHWTFPWTQARWFINVYEKKRHNNNMNPLLLEFAKLDFNLVQATYQKELKQLSRWWRGTCLAEKLPFVRDRMVECFIWIAAATFEPQYGLARSVMTKLGALVTVIDDVYDVYGSIEELELFTGVLQRWEMDSINQLPDYMQLCFLAINNFVNEAAYDVLKETGVVTISHLRKAFTDFCKAQLKEAKWSSSECCPTLKEYLDNAWITIAGPIAVAYAFPFVTKPLRSEDFEYVVENYPHVIRWSSIIARLVDDLGTSTDEMKRGDVSKSIQCCMNDTGASEDEARNHIRFMINQTWKKVNKYLIMITTTSHHHPICSSQKYTKVAANYVRMAHYVYSSGDGFGIQSDEAKDVILDLLFKPIPLTLRTQA